MGFACDSAFWTGYWFMAGAVSFLFVAVVAGFAVMAFIGYLTSRRGG